MTVVYPPTAVIPAALSQAVGEMPAWFVIGGHAVRCFCPYRPSRDVDFGVRTTADLHGLLERLAATGSLDVLERSVDTVHARWNGVPVSVFVVPQLAPFVEDRRLSVTGILATKVHAIVDRGTRRDFFDLYVTMQTHGVGIAECLAAVREVYQTQVKESLLLRALTYFRDAEREAALPGEGAGDFERVKDYLMTRVGNLLVPPMAPLEIQKRQVDVTKS